MREIVGPIRRRPLGIGIGRRLQLDRLGLRGAGARGSFAGMNELRIISANEPDVALILNFIRKLAEYETVARGGCHRRSITRRVVRPPCGGGILLAYWGDEPAGFALYFLNFSTFLGKPGIYLEDLSSSLCFAAKGLVRLFLIRLAQIARERGCGRLEWAVLDWNRPAIEFYRSLGAVAKDDWTIFRLMRDALLRLGIDGSGYIPTMPEKKAARTCEAAFLCRLQLAVLYGHCCRRRGATCVGDGESEDISRLSAELDGGSGRVATDYSRARRPGRQRPGITKSAIRGSRLGGVQCDLTRIHLEAVSGVAKAPPPALTTMVMPMVPPPPPLDGWLMLTVPVALGE